MEKSTLIGLVTGLLLVYGAIFMGEGWQTFFDGASFVLVMGGTVAALLVGYTIDEFKQSLQGFKAFFTFQTPDRREVVETFAELARVARREGLLALDRRLGEIEDAFTRFGMEMAVDGVEEAAIREMMGRRLREEMQQRQLTAKFFTTAGTYAPAFGMVGTLIGLIQMLQNLTDPSAVGPAMAVALITTFYGALIANLLFLPFGNKMRAQTGEVLKVREMAQTGVLAIVQGESPSMIEKQLRLFLPGNEDADVPAPTPLAKAA